MTACQRLHCSINTPHRHRGNGWKDNQAAFVMVRAELLRLADELNTAIDDYFLAWSPETQKRLEAARLAFRQARKK